MINPGAIPQIPGDMEVLAGHARSLQQTGSAFAETGSDVHAAWQGLAPVYVAPESGQLLAATAPVSRVAGDVGADVAAVGGALAVYADTVRPIKARLEQLRAEATAFVSSVDGDEDWQEDGDKVGRHNGLLSAVNDAVEAWMAAQRTCANAISALYGGTQWKQDNADGTAEANEFGYSADTLDAAMASDQGLPWGGAEEEDRGFWGGLWEGTKGFFVDGLWGDLVGLGNLVGIGGWEAFKQSWAGIGNLVGLGGWEAFKDGWVGLGKGILAWDEWSTNPARAFGQVLFNVFTLPIAFTKVTKLGKVGTAGRVADAAGDASRLGRLTGALNKLPTIDELAAAARNKLPDFRLPDLGPRPAFAGIGDGPPRTPDAPRTPTVLHMDRHDGPGPGHAPDAPESAGRYPTAVDDGPRHGDADGHQNGDAPSGEGHDAGDGAGDGDATHGDGDGHAAGSPDGDTPIGHDGGSVPVRAGPGRIPPPITDGPTLSTKEMAERFRYETDASDPRNPFGSAVERLSDEAREELRVFVGDDGLIYGTDGLPLDTRGSNTHWGGQNSDRAIFVMDEHGNLYASRYQARGEFHHSTLASGRPVAGAGEIHVVDGRLVGITDQSGHYAPGRTMTRQVLAVLESYGVDLSNVYVDVVAPEGT